MVDSPVVVSGKADALAALDRVAPSKQQLQNDDKRHEREAAVMGLQIAKYYENLDKERTHQTAMVIVGGLALLALFSAALFAGKPDLAEKIFFGVLPVVTGAGGVALGSRSKKPAPKASGANDPSDA
jgi:hypothetical protein